MIKKIVILVILSIALLGCSGETAFTIGKDHVGPITRTTSFADLKTLFENDSLVTETGSQEISSAKGDLILYEKGGKKLLQLSPTTAEGDKKVKFIQIFDKRYTTAQGINLGSTFKDIQDAYTLRRIENLIATIVIFVNEGDEYFTIDKKHLPANLMFDTDTKIEATQIPDDTPIKYLMIGW